MAQVHYFGNSYRHLCVLPVISAFWFSSVQLLSCVRLFAPHGVQHARLPCPLPAPGACSNSCPSISVAIQPSRPLCPVVPFSCFQSFPASGSFSVSQFFTSGGWSIEASASVLPMNIQDWFPLGLTGLILQSKGLSRVLQSKGLWRVFSSTTVQKHQFFNTQLSLWSNCHIHTWPLEKPWVWLDGPFLAK